MTIRAGMRGVKRAPPESVVMSSTTTEADLRDRIGAFLRRNFPQIEMHGGSAAIQSLDVDEGSVTIRLGGACSGCGVSPMTTQALKTRLVQEIPEIRRVETETGVGDEETPRGIDPEDVPF